jgi:hypothetical protein
MKGSEFNVELPTEKDGLYRDENMQANDSVIAHREVIVEIERLQVIRQRAQTSLIFCENCQTVGDFIDAEKASEIFKTPKLTLISFVRTNGGHGKGIDGNTPMICLSSLLLLMKNRSESKKTKQLGS